jgi:NAD(P)-dependent dehydrogenase (short-subunit alcohol dehydrogenase family)
MSAKRSPKKGKKPAKSVPLQKAPGVERRMKPPADHGEQSYGGNGRLEGLVALITGGDSGIGRAVAIAFAREGADVAIGYLAEKGIRVNCVAPGPVWTPLIPATMSRKHVQKFGEDTFWGRPAQPAEIAPSYVFLASAEGRYYSGEIFAPTGSETSR